MQQLQNLFLEALQVLYSKTKVSRSNFPSSVKFLQIALHGVCVCVYVCVCNT